MHVLRVVQPAGDPTRRVDPLEPRLDLIGIKEVSDDKATKRIADPLLVLRDDRGVRDRQSQWMPE